MSKNKPKKEKIIYYDDNSTVADMSNVSVGRNAPKKPIEKQKNFIPLPEQETGWKAKVKTYFATMRMMFLPMCIVLLILAGLFGLLLLLS